MLQTFTNFASSIKSRNEISAKIQYANRSPCKILVEQWENATLKSWN